MASDLPPYLSHSQDRAVPWKGHDTFPRRVFQARERGQEKYGWPKYMDDLRVFKKSYGSIGDAQYVELHETEIEPYLSDPTHA